MFIDLLGYPIDKPPSLTELLQVEIPLLVGKNYEPFGIRLLDDRSGKRVEVIMDNHRGNAEGITTQILKVITPLDARSCACAILASTLNLLRVRCAGQVRSFPDSLVTSSRRYPFRQFWRDLHP